MKKYLEYIYLTYQANFFWFLSGQKNPSKFLKTATKDVPNKPGLYFVFAEGKLNEADYHLHYNFDGQNYTLCYFGKAGGITKAGKILKQGLNDRINNVVSDNGRNLKYVYRAVYWDIIMSEYRIQKLHIRYIVKNDPIILEGIIYNLLNEKKLKYPIMNKPLGRRIAYHSCQDLES